MSVVVVRGGGELGTGVAHALARAGFRVLVVDRPLPAALRLGVAFAAAAVRGSVVVEGIEAVLCASREDVSAVWAREAVPVWTGAEAELALRPHVIVDARMRRLTAPLTRPEEAPVTIGIGPGFEAGGDVRYVIESNRGPHLGRVLTSGSAEPHTGLPGDVLGHREDRILRAPRPGVFVRRLTTGDFVDPGDVVGAVDGEPVRARLSGMVRGLKLTGVEVGEGHKVGDVDPRRDRALLTTMTDKSRAVGAGALHAIALAGLFTISTTAASSPAPPARARE